MKPTRIRRRSFLERTSTLGLLAMTAGGRTAISRAAETGPAGGTSRLPALEKQLEDMAADGPRYLAVAAPDGRFLNLLVRAARARRVLELGTAMGYAAIWMAAGLEETGGKLTTIEILADRAEAARKHAAAAGVSQRIQFLEGDAHKLLPTMAGPFDLVYLNADKDGLTDYFQKLNPTRLSDGALLVAFGALKAREKMKPYLDMIGSRPDFDTVIVSATLDDGFAVSCRRQAAVAPSR